MRPTSVSRLIKSLAGWSTIYAGSDCPEWEFGGRLCLASCLTTRTYAAHRRLVYYRLIRTSDTQFDSIRLLSGRSQVRVLPESPARRGAAEAGGHDGAAISAQHIHNRAYRRPFGPRRPPRAPRPAGGPPSIGEELDVSRELISFKFQALGVWKGSRATVTPVMSAQPSFRSRRLAGARPWWPAAPRRPGRTR